MRNVLRIFLFAALGTLLSSSLYALETRLPDSQSDRVQLGNDILQSLRVKEISGTSNLLQLYHSPAPDAYALKDGRIFISSGLIDEVRNIDELAFVIAHELAHIELGEHSHSEYDADLKAINSLKLKGFKAIAGIELLQRCCKISKIRSRGAPLIMARVHHIRNVLNNENSKKFIALDKTRSKSSISNNFY